MEIILEINVMQNMQLILPILIQGYLFRGLELIIMENICYHIRRGYLGLCSTRLGIFITRPLVLLRVDFYADVLWIKYFFESYCYYGVVLLNFMKVDKKRDHLYKDIV